MMKRRVIFFLFLSLVLGSGGCGMGTLSAGPPLSVDTGVDPWQWARVPAGPFFRGQHDRLAAVDYDFEIMVTDVTVEQYAIFVTSALEAAAIHIEADRVVGYYPGDPFHGAKHEEPIAGGEWLLVPLADSGLRLLRQGQSFEPARGFEDHPMTHVTWFGARAFCQFYGWRLPNELEWEKAARGTDNRPFPWGTGISPQYANYRVSYDPFKRFGEGGGTTPVGMYNGRTYDGFISMPAASPYGLYDMAGNVWQWVGDVYPGVHYRYMRGGSWMDYGYNLRIWTRNSARPDYYSPSVGFRCVREVGN